MKHILLELNYKPNTAKPLWYLGRYVLQDVESNYDVETRGWISAQVSEYPLACTRWRLALTPGPQSKILLDGNGLFPDGYENSIDLIYVHLYSEKDD